MFLRSRAHVAVLTKRHADEFTDRLFVHPGATSVDNPVVKCVLERGTFRHIWRTSQARSDEGAQTGTTFGDPLMLEFSVGPVHRVGIDRDLSDDVTYRRELVSVLQ